MATSYFPHQEEDQPKPRVIWDKVYGWIDSETGDPIPGGPDSVPGRTLNTPPNAAGQTEPIDPRTTGGKMPPIPQNQSLTPVPQADAPINPAGVLGGLARKAAPWAGRILGPPGALIGSTTPVNTGEFHPNVRPDIALGGKPTGIPFPSGPGYGQGPFAGRPDYGYGQGPFAGRPDPVVSGGGVGQGPFAGRPDTVTGGPGRSPSGPVAAPPGAAPAVSPAAAVPSAVAAQRPNLGYYMTDRPNLPAGQQGGRGGPSQTQMGMFGFDPNGPFLGLGGPPAVNPNVPAAAAQNVSAPAGILAARPDLAQRIPLANTPLPPIRPRRQDSQPNQGGGY